MQPTKNEIKPWELIEIGYRRRWEIILPLFITVMVGLILLFVLPKAYEASTLILAQPQELPSDIVRAPTPEDRDSRLSSIAQLVLNRANLEGIVREFNLYSDPKKPNFPLEGKIDQLRRNVMIEWVEEGLYADAFTIAFEGEEPNTVMEVANALTSYFIEANLVERETSAIETSEFLAEELENARKRLGEMEETLKDYRQKYMGELPEQLDSNLATLERLQAQLNNKEDDLREIRLSVSTLEKQIEEERYLAKVSSLSGREGPTVLEVETTDIEVLKEQLANLLTRYTEQHPDVKNLKNKIAQLEADGISNKGGSSSINRNGFTSSKTRYIQKLERQRSGLLVEKQSVEDDIFDLNREIANYQVRVENTPKREQEYITLQRDYDNLSDLYKSLLNRKLEAEMSVNMERQKKGEQFQILERANLPRNPTKPNIKLMIILCIGLGIGVGSGLILLLENMRNTYSGPDEIETVLELPVIAAIPKVLTKRDIFMKRAELTLCSVIVFMTFVAIGLFTFLSLTGTDQAIEMVQQYLST